MKLENQIIANKTIPDFPPQDNLEQEPSFSENLRWLLSFENKLNNNDYKNKREIKTEMESRSLPDNYLFNLFKDKLNKILNMEENGISMEEDIEEYIKRNIGNLSPLQKLTSNLVGVYDRKGELRELADIEANQKFIPRAKMFSTLSDIPENKTQELENKFLDFKVLSNKFFRYHIEKDFNISLENVDLKVQFWLMDLIKDKSTEEIKKVQKFAREYGEDGIKTFLAMENGPEYGDKILKIGETFENTSAQKIFAKFQEIFGLIDNVDNYLEENFAEQLDKAPELKKELKNNLLKNSTSLLDKYASLTKEKISELSDEEIKNDLENIKAEIVLFTESFKELRKETGFIDLQELKATHLSILNSEQMREQGKEIIEEMKNIYLQNYEGFPEEFRQKLIEGLGRAINEGASTFYILRDNKEQIISFLRLDVAGIDEESGKPKKHFGAFNVNPKYRGAKLGEVMMENIIDKEAKTNVIEAECVPQAQISQKYISTGFVGTEKTNIGGVELLKIIRDEEKNRKIGGKTFTKDEIINNKINNPNIEVKITKNNTPDLGLLEQGYELVQYFTEKDKTYTVFEKRKIIKTMAA